MTFSQVEVNRIMFEDYIERDKKAEIEAHKLWLVQIWIGIWATLSAMICGLLITKDDIVIPQLGFFVVNSVVFALSLVLSVKISKKLSYIGLFYLQFLCLLFLFLLPRDPDPAEKQFFQLTSVTLLLCILFNQELISSLFIRHQIKLKYLVYFIVYHGFIYQFIGSDLFENSSSKVLI